MDTQTQGELDLFGGMHAIDAIHMPSDDDIHEFGGDEQKAIEHCIQYAMRTTGCNQAALAAMSEMNKSQFSLLWSGQRGIPMGRFISFMRATGSAGLLKFYADSIGLLVKTKAEWGALVRGNKLKQSRIEQLEQLNQGLINRLSPYEDVSQIAVSG